MGQNTLIADIERRFGLNALRHASDLVQTREKIATQIDQIDLLLDGGLLLHTTHSLFGQPTSGATSLLYQLVASLQRQSLPVLYLDMGEVFDPPKASGMGVDVGSLLLTQPQSLKHTLFLIQTVAHHLIPCLVVVDTPTRLPLCQVKATLRKAPLLLLTLSPRPLPQMQVQLGCQRRSWQMVYGDFVSFTSAINLIRHPLLSPRRTQMTFAVPKEDEHV